MGPKGPKGPKRADWLGLALEEAGEPRGRFSPCRRYRYELWRRWAPGPYCMFIGLNPSTADEESEDPTVRRCMGFARSWGCGALCMTNLFAFRATDPEVMKWEPEPVGADNDATLVRLAAGAGIVVAAWGVHGSHLGRAAVVAALIQGLQCLGRNLDGSPKHPLYVAKDRGLEGFGG
jgi:hypothetical protein